jgi:hypothetical protein
VIAKETGKRGGLSTAALFRNSRPIMSNPEQSESLSNPLQTQIALYNEGNRLTNRVADRVAGFGG